MISSGLSITKPVAAAARPEYEFSRAITTGMSAPPIEKVSVTPSTPATATSAQKRPSFSGFMTTRTQSTSDARTERALSWFRPVKVSFFDISTPAMSTAERTITIGQIPTPVNTV